MSKKYALGMISIFFIVFIVLIMTLFKTPISEILSFLFYQFALILIPGVAFAIILKNKIPFISLCCLGYALGYSINIFEYFLIQSLNCDICKYIIPSIILLISIVVLVKNKTHLKESFSEINKTSQVITLSFLIGLLFLNIFVYSLQNINLATCHRDLLWWVHNSVALRISFPPENVFMSGTNLFYHYFSNIQIALFNIISGIDIKSLSLIYNSFTKTIIMVSAVDFALNVLKISNPKIRIIGFLLVLFTTGLEHGAHLTYFHHIMHLPFGFDIGYAFSMLYIALLVKQFYSNSFDIKLFIPSLIFLFVSCGAKAPITVVTLVFSGLMCLYWLCKKSYKLSLLYGISVLSIFLYVSYTFVGMGTVIDGTSNSWTVGLHPLSEYNENPIFAIIIVILKLLVANIPLTISTILSILILKDIFQKTKINSDDFWVLTISFTSTIIGLLLWMCVLHVGASEMYYGMASFICAYFFIATTYKLTVNNLDKISNKKIITYKTLFIIALIVGLYLFSFGAYKRNGAIRTVFKSLKNINTQEKEENIKPLLWLRKNSPIDSIILADNISDDTYYTYGILTERKQYLEEDYMFENSTGKVKDEMQKRKNYINSIFKNDKKALENLKNEKIDYVVSTKDITSEFKPDEKYLILVTSNEKYKVYKVE